MEKDENWLLKANKPAEADAKDWVLPLALLPGITPTPTQPMNLEDPPAVESPAELPVGWQHYEHLIGPAASSNGVPADLLERLLKTENDVGNPRAKSGKGAVGLAQFMPETATWMGIDPLDPEHSRTSSATGSPPLPPTTGARATSAAGRRATVLTARCPRRRSSTSRRSSRQRAA
jgi:hypothetical protein